MAITFNNAVYGAGFAGQDDGAPSAGFGIDNVSTNNITVNGTVKGVGDPVTVTGLLPGSSDTGNTATTNTLYVTQFSNTGMVQFSDKAPGTQSTGANRYVLSNSTLAARQRVTFDNDTSVSEYQPVCFVTGTLIRTTRGDVAVEDLAVGDLAVTHAGEAREIRWIGHRVVDCRRHPDRGGVLPVRIMADALGENLPSRDLLVSPNHAVCVDVLGQVLIPAGALLNGATIVQEEVETVTYWHVELDSHDLLVAEGLAAESYLEMGNRSFFSEASVVALGGLPGGSAPTHADFCRPFHAGGALVEVVRQRSQARAKAMGWRLDESDAWAGAHLEADGVRIEPQIRGLSARFTLPEGAQDVWLVSGKCRPWDIGFSADDRSLGLFLSHLSVQDDWETRAIALDDVLLCVGFHGVEDDKGELRRWTAGRARLPAALWARCNGTVVFRLELARAALAQWVRPDTSENATTNRAHLHLVASAA